MRSDEKLISIIVPIYNVESYLRKCLDSILAQTYRNLEIILVDDGSTDNSGKICDEYTELDNRIIVVHTNNHGLSAARNLGLDSATGEYIGFVDSDDWIDLDMYEILIQTAENTGMDIVECGFYEEYSDVSIRREKYNQIMTGSEIVVALLREELSDNVWNKLWKRKCFIDIRFPENRLFEDVVTTYRIFSKVNSVQSMKCCKYHYLQRKSGLSRQHSMKNLVDYWQSHFERYTNLKCEVSKEAEQDLFRYCTGAAARAWAYFDDCTIEEKNTYSEIFHQMNAFIKEHIPLFGHNDWDIILRIGSFFPHYFSAISFRMSWMLNRLKGNRQKAY